MLLAGDGSRGWEEAAMQVYGQLVHVEEFDRDSTGYRVAIFRVQGRLLGKWSCAVCAEDESQTHTHPTIEESVASVKQTIEQHHRRRHA
jgi:hypothetical protein